MIGLDTNLLIYARIKSSPFHVKSLAFLEGLRHNPDVVLAELVLVEYYLALRNPVIFSPALDSPSAVAECEIFRRHPHWQLAEEAKIMDKVWKDALTKDFARRRIIDVRLARTLQAFGVQDFATANPRDFGDLGFRRVWNPLLEIN